jgi:phosphomannomutase
LLAFATLALKAEAGVMITASHNPAQDNGLKVFGMNGAQVIPPDDALIMAAIDGIAVPKTVSSFQVLCAEGMVRSVPDQVETDYLLSMERLRIHRFSGIRIAYTPLHGVGWRLVKHVLNNAGHMDLHVVTEQAEPDGDFPTVTSPNPEDEEALNRAISLAKDLDADLVLANDPDSDRLAVAVPDDQQGSWRILTGDEISSLLADYLLEHGPKEGKQLVVTNLLSSGLLEKVVESHEATYVETRVGFKWVADQAIKWQAAGGQCVLASEEALGFSAGGVVCDKDGISTALLMADLSAWCHAQGGTLLSYLERIYQRYGIYATDKSAFTMPGPEGSDRIRYILDDLRRNPLEEVAGIQVTRISDRIAGSNTIGFFLYDGSRILARASGSEPKVKFYFRVHELPAHKPLADLEVRAKQRLIRLKNALLERVGLEIEGTIHGK